MWHIPEPIIASQDEKQALAFVPVKGSAFLKKSKELYSQPDAESYDVLEFKMGNFSSVIPSLRK